MGAHCVIGFGCVTANDEEFKGGAAQAIESVAEADSLLLRRHDPESVGAPCNDMLDRASERTDLEAFVLMAEDVSFERPGFAARLRELLSTDPDIALALATERLADVRLLGGGLLVFTPTAAAELRFDATLDVPFGCAVADICRQARARGRRVVAGDFGVARPVQCKRLGDRGRLVRGAVALRRKWAAQC